MTIFILALYGFLFKKKKKAFQDINLFIMKSSQNKKQGTLCCSLGKHNHELLQIFVIGGKNDDRYINESFLLQIQIFNTKKESKLSHLV